MDKIRRVHVHITTTKSLTAPIPLITTTPAPAPLPPTPIEALLDSTSTNVKSEIRAVLLKSALHFPDWHARDCCPPELSVNHVINLNLVKCQGYQSDAWSRLDGSGVIKHQVRHPSTMLRMLRMR